MLEKYNEYKIELEIIFFLNTEYTVKLAFCGNLNQNCF